MKFKPLQVFGFFACALLLSVVYAVIFGDAGLWMRGELRERENTLKENIKELRRENQVLHRKFHDQARQGPAAAHTASHSRGIILKFNEPVQGRAPGTDHSGREKGLSIQEARGLYTVGALFLLLLGGYVASRGGAPEDMIRRKNPGRTADRHA